MKHEYVKQQLVIVLTTIQTNSGLACPPFDGKLKPVEELEKFTSKVWPAAIGMLAAALNFEIDDDVNIFASKDGSVAYTIDEAADIVCKLANSPKPAEQKEAAQ